MKAQEQIEKLRTLQESMHDIADKVVSLGDGSVILNDVADGKKRIAEAINIKGGNSTPDESFQQLADDIQTLPYAGISAEGIVQTEPFSFVQYLTNDINISITELNTSEITSISRCYAFYKNITLSKVSLPNLTTISGSNTFQSCTSLQEVSLPNLTTISGSGSTFLGCTSLQEISLPNLTTISCSNTFQACSSLQNVTFPNLTTISGANCFAQCESTKKVNLPNITIISAVQTFWGCSSLEAVTFGTLTTLVETFRDNSLNLRSITIGQGTNINLQFQKWTATNVIAEGQSGIDELNENLYNNLLTKLYDHSQDGQTRTLRLGWLAHVTQENIDYANSKGWTLTT